MGLVVALLIGFFIFETIGAVIHRLMHARWTGPLWRSHMEHHRLYPPKDAFSDVYRTLGAKSAAFRYIAAGAIITMFMLLTMPIAWSLALAAEMALIGWLNDKVHDATHLTGHWLERYGWFQRMRETHRLHHRNMRHNYGLMTFTLDRLAGWYRTPSE